MGYALVGSLPAVQTGTTSVTGVWGTGESRTAGNLLICWLLNFGSAGTPAAPSGWSIGKQQAGSSAESSNIYYKIAAGADAAPSFSGLGGSACACMLAEFSGNASSSPLDQTAGATGSTGTDTATAGGTDAVIGNLFISCCNAFYSTANTKTLSQTITPTFTGGSTTNNNSTSIVNHYSLTWTVFTDNSTADKDVFTYTTTKVSGTAVALCSFKPAPAVTVQIPTSFTVLQAVHRTSTY